MGWFGRSHPFPVFGRSLSDGIPVAVKVLFREALSERAQEFNAGFGNAEEERCLFDRRPGSPDYDWLTHG